MNEIPVYALYGEHEQPFLPERLHSESIPERSRLYEWTIDPHRHDLFAQILYIRRGSGHARLDQCRMVLQPPCAVWVPAKHEHGFRFSRDVDGDVITVVAHYADTLLDDPDLSGRLSAPWYRPLGDQHGRAAAAALGVLLAEIGAHEPGRLAAIESGLRLVLVRLARLHESHTCRQPGGCRSTARLRAFTALIDRHLREARPLSFYAAQLGISVPQLNRLCRAQLGVSAFGVIQRRLVREAERDLVYSTLSVKAIALTLGFADAGYFSRFFARHTGCSPSRFREHAWRRLSDGVSAAVGAGRHRDESPRH